MTASLKSCFSVDCATHLLAESDSTTASEVQMKPSTTLFKVQSDHHGLRSSAKQNTNLNRDTSDRQQPRFGACKHQRWLEPVQVIGMCLLQQATFPEPPWWLLPAVESPMTRITTPNAIIPASGAHATTKLGLEHLDTTPLIPVGDLYSSISQVKSPLGHPLLAVIFLSYIHPMSTPLAHARQAMTLGVHHATTWSNM